MKRLIATLVLFFFVGTANATINNSVSKNIVLGNGSQTQFTFNFIGVAANYITVIYTDTSGNQTVLTQGSGSTQYTIVLNPPVTGAIWGVGGTVTYNPGGTPIANGTTLTIYRTLPLTQAISLQGLSSIATLGKGSETGLDTGVMQGQQINETIGRAIVANIANLVAPLPLPAAAAAANQGVCFDSTGNNLIACSLAPSGIISSAMSPVVGASTLPLGRTAFGLGTMAVENINSGTCGGNTLQDDGSGNARVVFAQASDSTSQSVTCAFSQTQRVATGPITYTLPRANTLFAGWGFKVYVAAGPITFTPNASDKFTGVSSGASVTVSAGSVCDLSTNAVSSGLWQLNCNNSPPSISANVGSNALTLTLNGSALNFRDTTITSGAPLWALITSGLNITIPSGATIGTSNSVPFRLWIFAAYNSGTPILGVAKCSGTANIYSCKAAEVTSQSSVGISSGSTSAGLIYTSSAVSNDSFRIIGYVEYSSGLATAGSWTSIPTKVQLCIPPFTCPRPGDLIQSTYLTSTTAATTTTVSPFVQLTNTPSISFILTSAMNLVEVSLDGVFSTGNATAFIQLARGTTQIGSIAGANAGTGVYASARLFSLDSPNSISAQTYSVYGKTTSGTLTLGGSTLPVVMSAKEIMG